MTNFLQFGNFGTCLRNEIWVSIALVSVVQWMKCYWNFVGDVDFVDTCLANQDTMASLILPGIIAITLYRIGNKVATNLGAKVVKHLAALVVGCGRNITCNWNLSVWLYLKSSFKTGNCNGKPKKFASPGFTSLIQKRSWLKYVCL